MKKFKHRIVIFILSGFYINQIVHLYIIVDVIFVVIIQFV